MRSIFAALVTDKTAVSGTVTSSATLGTSYAAQGSLHLAELLPRTWPDVAALMGAILSFVTIIYVIVKIYILLKASKAEKLKKADEDE